MTLFAAVIGCMRFIIDSLFAKYFVLTRFSFNVRLFNDLKFIYDRERISFYFALSVVTPPILFAGLNAVSVNWDYPPSEYTLSARLFLYPKNTPTPPVVPAAADIIVC